jgi:hypothetical protein
MYAPRGGASGKSERRGQYCHDRLFAEHGAAIALPERQGPPAQFERHWFKVITY